MDPGDTDLLMGTLMDINDFTDANKMFLIAGGVPATGRLSHIELPKPHETSKRFRNVRRSPHYHFSRRRGSLGKGAHGQGNQNIISATKQGIAICFSETDVRPMGRNTRGVRDQSCQR